MSTDILRPQPAVPSAKVLHWDGLLALREQWQGQGKVVTAKDLRLVDFDVDALGRVNLLAAARRYCPEAALIFVSTDWVHGTKPSEKRLVELCTR